jgi:hypothetical protein
VVEGFGDIVPQVLQRRDRHDADEGQEEGHTAVTWRDGARDRNRPSCAAPAGRCAGRAGLDPAPRREADPGAGPSLDVALRRNGASGCCTVPQPASGERAF